MKGRQVGALFVGALFTCAGLPVTATSQAFKIPQSVLVVIHTPALEVLLIKRADADDFWQSVTGSKDRLDESFLETARREVMEETGIDCRPGSRLADPLQDWDLENIYEIYPRWRHRYAPGVTHNTEHLFALQVPAGTPVRLSPREHTAYRWLPWREAAEACYSPSNAEACLLLPRLAFTGRHP
jgi:dATP pyrophosphohydrolase